ncbi:MAG: alpha/beta hydrolase family protein [Candidatus Thorarchaeota archaeon]
MDKKFLIPRGIGGNLHAVHFLSEKEYTHQINGKNPFAILCHGLTGDKCEWGRFNKTAEALNEEGIDAVLFDFSGSGENERELITLSKQAKDLEDVYKWTQNQGYKWIAVLGLSFGGLTALIASLPDVKTYIFWAPAFFIKELFSEMTKNKEKKLSLPSSGDYEPIIIDYTFVEDLSGYDIESHLKNLGTPALIVQGTRDKSVQLSQTRKAFSIMPQDKNHNLSEIEKATHNFDGIYLDKFIKITINWIKKYI